MKIISRQPSSCVETIVAFPAKRIKFKCDAMKLPRSPVSEEWMDLAKTLDLMRSYGCCPVAEGGYVSGNIAIRIKNYLIVSRSKRRLAGYRPEDFPKVIKFDFKAWKATFQSRSRAIEPTSDTPLHWMALVEAPKKLKWSERPLVSLHGHALTTARSAHHLKLPISSKKTAFGTAEDCAALMDLFKRYPYPKNKIFIRRGHGFLLLGRDIADVIATFQRVLGRKKKPSHFRLENYRAQCQLPYGMLNHLYGHSLLFIATFVIGSCIAVGLLGQWIAHRFLSIHHRLSHNQVIGYTSATCALIYVVLLAFIASTVWVSYDRADEAVSRESSLVGDLFQDAAMVSPSFEAAAGVLLRDYTRVVVNQEWPKMARGEPGGGEGWQLLRKFYTELSQLTDTHPVKVAVIEEMISRVNHLYDIRRERLRTAAGASLNSAVWLVVLLGGLITLSFCWLFGFDKGWIHSLSTSLIAMTLGLVIFLIVVFNCPFRGQMQISVSPFEKMLKYMDRRISASQQQSPLSQK